MDNFDLTQRVSSLSLLFMLFSLILVVFVCVLLFCYIRNTYPEGHQGLFAGIAAYFLIANVILTLLFLLLSTVGGQFMKGMSEDLQTPLKNAGNLLSLIIQCFVLVYCVEFAYRHYVYQPGDSRFGDALMFAFGYGLVETFQFSMNTFLNWLMGYNINGVGLAALKEAVDAEQWGEYLEEISFLFTNTPDVYIAGLIERFLYLAFVFAMISMIHFVAAKKADKTFLVYLSLMYIVYCIPSLLKNWGVVTNIWLLLLLYAVIVAMICLFAWQVLSKAAPEDAGRIRDTWKKGIIRTAFQKKPNGPKKKNIESFHYLNNRRDKEQ